MTKRKLTRQQNIIVMARKLGVAGKHAGSKPIKRLLNGIHSVQERARIESFIAEKRASKQKKAPEKLTTTNAAEEIQATVAS